MKSLTGKFTSVRGWTLLLALLLGAGMMISACGDEEVPTPTTPAPTPAPAPTPTPTPTPEPEPTGPATPTGLRISASGSNFLEWTWNAVEGALGYQGQFSPGGVFTDADSLIIKTAAQTSHRIDNLSANTTGYFRVRSGSGSLTDLQYSDWSDGVTGTTSAPPPAVPLSAPTGFSATNREDNSITLSWSAVDDADTYEVGQREGSGSWGSASCGGDDNEVDGTGCVASGLDEATEYDFRVRAVPASDDDTLATSSWTELDDAVSTTGTPPPTTVSGGDDDLGLRWANNSDGTEIVWDWAPVADRADRLRVEHRLNLQNASTGDQDCPMLSDVADTDTLVPADGLIALGDTWINAGSGTSARFAARESPNTTYQFCVVRTWEDERGVRQFGKDIAHALAAALPLAPTVPNNQPEIFDAAGTSTTKYRWGVTLRRGFDYDVRVVSGLVGSFATPTNDQCSDGTPASITGPARQQSVAETYEASATSKYTDYGLCYRAKNDDGQSQWAKTDSARTTLPATPGLGSVSWRDNNATMVVSFPDKDTLPSSDSLYDVQTFITDKSVDTATQKAACNATVPSVTGVTVLASPTSGGSPTPLANSWEVTFAHGQTKSAADPPNPASIHVYVCVRAKRDATSEGNASPWAIKSASRTDAQLPE